MVVKRLAEMSPLSRVLSIVGATCISTILIGTFTWSRSTDANFTHLTGRLDKIELKAEANTKGIEMLGREYRKGVLDLKKDIKELLDLLVKQRVDMSAVNTNLQNMKEDIAEINKSK